MSRLSPGLKALINSPRAKPNVTPAPARIESAFAKIAHEAPAKDISLSAWLSFTVATTFTMNSPESLLRLHALVTRLHPSETVYAAELIREIGVKCIGFNGIPRSINCLNAFYAGLPSHVRTELTTTPTRSLKPDTVSGTVSRGNGLWKSIYTPLDEKLRNKLAQSHPDLAVYIIESAYGALFSDSPESNKPASVGRVLTSLVAIACLRAQTGTGPQVISHVFGLRKALENEIVGIEDEQYIRGARWLASDEGSIWLLNMIDDLVEILGSGTGSTFATGPTRDAKL